MATTRRRSSLGQLISSVANKTFGNVRVDIDLTSLECDLLASYQLSLTRITELGQEAFYATRIVQNKELSYRIHEALLKIGVLLAPNRSDQDQLSIDTSKITRNFANQLPYCSAFVMRRVVSLLFVFEEQAARWRLLEQEEAELNELLRQPPSGMQSELEVRLQAVRYKKALLPSQQDTSGTQRESELPVYSRD